MTDRKKILSRLCILQAWCKVNPEYGMGLDVDDCRKAAVWLEDTIALLKAQEPRLMTQADINNIGQEDVCAFVEVREETHMYACYMRQYDVTHTVIMCDIPDLPMKLQNGCARIWTSRPTDEQREVVKWND